MSLQQKKVFIAGMDSDTTDENLTTGADRYRLNVRALSSDGSTEGAIETMNGNDLAGTTILPAGTNKVIGSIEYLIGKKVYYFLYNSNGDHAIYQYDIETDIISTVLAESELNFDSDYLITGINVIELDEDNHLLYWTDGLNLPRKINIEKGIFHTAGDYVNGYKAPFDISWISRIKKPPTRPSYAWSDDAARVVNLLLNKNYQFKAQFVYDDNEVSAWSAYSVYDFPIVDYVVNNCDDDYTQENIITISFDTGSSIVTRIRISAKETNETDFVLIADISKEENLYADNATESIVFLNDGLYTPLDIDESIKLFDNVPLTSKAQDIIAGNRIVDGNIKEGFDQVPVDFRMNVEQYVNVDNHSVDPKQITEKSYFKSGGSWDVGIVYYNEYNQSGTANLNKGLYTDILPNNIYGSTLKLPFFTETTFPAQSMDLVPEVRFDIYNEAPSWATHYQMVRSKNNSMSKYLQFVSQGVFYQDGAGALIDPTAVAPATCFIEMDNILGRYKEEYPSSNLVYDFTEGDRVRIISNPKYAIGPPPVFATPPGQNYFFPAASRSTVYGAADIGFVPYNDYEITSWNSGAQQIGFKINDGAVIAAADLYLPGCIFEIYTPAKQADEENEILYEIGELNSISVDSNGKYVHEGQSNTQQILPAFTSFTFPGSSPGDNLNVTITGGQPGNHGLVAGDRVKVVGTGWSAYITIITPVAAGSDTVIQGVIQADGIQGSYVTGADTITVYVSAHGEFESGDSFRPYQDMAYVMYDGNPWGDYPGAAGPQSVYRRYSYVENMDVNNFFDSEQWDYGRPNKYDPNEKEITRPSTIRYSGQFIPETNINGLSSVLDNNFETYEDKYGGIQKLHAEDQSLISFQELKIAKIPVQQVIYNDLQGGSTVGASATVISPQPIYYAGEYGIGKNPESFAVYGKAKYGIDVRRGTPWRLSIDGLTPLASTANMHNYFTDKCQTVIASTDERSNIYGVYDVKFSEYILAFETSDTVVPETIAFNEAFNFFSTFYSFLPDNMVSAGLNIMSFQAGVLYMHNINSIQSRFYGVTYKSQVWVMVNVEPSKVKVLEAISEESNDTWEVYDISTPNGQSSNLIDDDFQEKENNQYAAVLRDVNTPNLTPGTELFNGDEMRDRTFLCKMRYNPSTYNKLYAVNFYVIPSERSNK